MKWLRNLLRTNRNYEKNAQALIVILRARIKELEAQVKKLERNKEKHPTL